MQTPEAVLEAGMQAILDQSPVAMLVVDATHGRLVHANRPATQLMNLPYPVPTLGADWKLAAASLQGVHADGRPYRAEDWPLAQSLTQGTAVAAKEIEFRRRDGSRGVLSMRSTPVRDARGKTICVLGILYDITEQRRAAERLRESEQRLQLLIDSALDYAIFMMDLESCIISWNRGAERLLGWSEDEAIGRSGALIFTPEDRGAGVFEMELETARREGRAVDERVHQRKDGERFWASGMLMSVYDDDGTLCRFAKIIRDETERKRAEQDLQRALYEAERARASAEEANRAKDEFISTISHELRTPLNTIRLWACMLGSQRLSEQDRIKGVKMIGRAAEAQQHLIDDLLDVSRMSSGQLRLNPRLTRLADVVRSAVESVRPSAEARKIQIVLELSDAVGVVRADPERMQQVLLNLISNAVKFTPGGGRIDVRMTRSGGSDDVIIAVTDTGIGIRPEFLPHVFERFRQAEVVTTRQHGGLGLGLAISKQLVELHGGSIAADSAGEGKGATFTARLPLPKSSGEQRDLPNLHSLDQSLNNLRVLLVEDDSGSRLATCRALEQRGGIVDAAPNAPLAMATYTQTPPDAMILDIGLPAEDGYSLIARIRELEAAQGLSRVPAIALTAFARTRDRERAFAVGFDEHLAKPVDIETLVTVLLGLTRRDRS